MEPTFSSGTTLLVSSIPYLFRNPLVNEIIVLQSPKDRRYIVKRIQKEKKDKYFVVGDNKEASTDSRNFGWIEKKDIRGKILMKL